MHAQIYLSFGTCRLLHRILQNQSYKNWIYIGTVKKDIPKKLFVFYCLLPGGMIFGFVASNTGCHVLDFSPLVDACQVLDFSLSLDACHVLNLIAYKDVGLNKKNLHLPKNYFYSYIKVIFSAEYLWKLETLRVDFQNDIRCIRWNDIWICWFYRWLSTDICLISIRH